MRCLIILAVASLHATSVAGATTLSVRAVDSGDPASVSVAVGETTTIEIVLEVADSATVDFAGLFFDITTDTGDDVFEAADFISTLPVPPATYDRPYIYPDDSLPYPFEEGILLDAAPSHSRQYYLSVTTGGTDGPTSVVLEQIVIRGLAPGTAQLYFEQGSRPPSLWKGSDDQWTKLILTAPGTEPPTPNHFALGLGDGREGGVGPITITVLPPGGDDEEPTGGDGDEEPEGEPDPPDEDEGDQPEDEGDDGDEPVEPAGGDEDDADDDSDSGPNQDGDNGDGEADDIEQDDDTEPGDGDAATPPGGDSGSDGSDDGDPDDADRADSGDDPADISQELPDSEEDQGNEVIAPSRPCGFGMMPALVGCLAVLGMSRLHRGRGGR